MMFRYLTSFAFLLAATAVSARADDIWIRGLDKSLAGTVKSETAKDVLVAESKTKKSISHPATEIVDIYYDKIAPPDLDIGNSPYKIAKNSEKILKDANIDPVKRKAAIKAALDGYTEMLRKMDRTKSAFYAPRNFEFKVAVLTLRQATTEGLATDKALAKLQAFKSKHPNSWQINQVMPMIAQLQMDAKDYKGAEDTFQEMVEMTDLPEEARRDAELSVVTVLVLAKNIDQANKKLDAMAKKASGNPSFAARVKMAKAEVFVGQKKNAEAEKLLHEIVRDTKDPHIKAIAHNTLGEALFKADKFSEALWEFLWVDTVYNQDKAQRAKALYYLWQTFQQLNNAERADECRLALMEDPQYAGTEYQRLAAAKSK